MYTAPATVCEPGVLFPLVHSGLASLRPWARQYTGERLWRVIFASFSLPLAYSWIVYYIGHVHDGLTFWNFQAHPDQLTYGCSLDHLRLQPRSPTVAASST